jgi:hypothetical protein
VCVCVYVSALVRVRVGACLLDRQKAKGEGGNGARVSGRGERGDDGGKGGGEGDGRKGGGRECVTTVCHTVVHMTHDTHHR